MKTMVIRLVQPLLLLPAPLLAPLLAWQGKRVRARIPRLPEAAGPTSGSASGQGRMLRLAVLGESTAAGVGAERHEEALAGFLAEEVARHTGREVHWTVVARNGVTAGVVRRELVPRVAQGDPPDAVVVAVGVNDLLQLRPMRTWQREAEAMLSAIRAEVGQVPVVLAGMPPVHRFPSLPQPLRGVLGLRARAMDRVLRDEAQVAPRAQHVPARASFEAGFSAADGFHPSSAGYRAWARILARYVVGGVAGARTS